MAALLALPAPVDGDVVVTTSEQRVYFSAPSFLLVAPLEENRRSAEYVARMPVDRERRGYAAEQRLRDELSSVSVQVLSSTHEGDATTIGVNAQYLRDAMAACGLERVELSFRGELDPMLVDYLDAPCRPS